MDIQAALKDGYTPQEVMGELSRRGVKMDYQQALADGHDPMQVLDEMNNRETRTYSDMPSHTPGWKADTRSTTQKVVDYITKPPEETPKTYKQLLAGTVPRSAVSNLLYTIPRGAIESIGAFYSGNAPKQIEMMKGMGLAALRYPMGLMGNEEAQKNVLRDPVGSALAVSPLIRGGVSGLSALKGGATPEIQLNNTIKTGIEKGIRPGVENNRTYGQSSQYMGKAQQAVKTIIANKDKLALTDEFGEPTQALPKNLKQFSQAIDQTKTSIFNQFNDMAQQAGAKNIEVPLSGVVPELQKVANNRVLQDMSPASAEYAKTKIEALQNRNTYTPQEAQDAIKILNQSLEAFYKNPSYDTASKAYIDSLVANNMRKVLDSTIEKASGPGYQELKNQYGALKTIERDVNRRAIVDARKNNKGLLDFSDVFSGSEVVRGLLNMNPATVGTGVTAKVIASLYKLKNDPNRIVDNMFKKSDRLINKQTSESLANKPPSNFKNESGFIEVDASPNTTLGKVTNYIKGASRNQLETLKGELRDLADEFRDIYTKRPAKGKVEPATDKPFRRLSRLEFMLSNKVEANTKATPVKDFARGSRDAIVQEITDLRDELKDMFEGTFGKK